MVHRCYLAIFVQWRGDVDSLTCYSGSLHRPDSAVVPIYQSEIASPKIRGRVVVFQMFAIICGIVVQYFIEYGCSFLDSTASFRVP
ncbi:hypothetical protein V1520DRAFT_350596 [Lipomyces starkeyi]